MVILELKQWESADIVDKSRDLVLANTHGSTFEEKIHPSLQANGYAKRFHHWLTVCDPGAKAFVEVVAYAVLYNMNPAAIERITGGEYTWIQRLAPTIGANGMDVLAAGLRRLFLRGNGHVVFTRICSSAIRPSKQFVEQAVSVIEQRDVFPLIPEQLKALAEIRRFVMEGNKLGRKRAFIVEGGPGSGKTAVALQIVADALRDNMKPVYVIKSAAMKYSIQRHLGDELRPLISFNDRFGFVPENGCDLLLVDEAHRLDDKAQIDWSKGTRRQKTRHELAASKSIAREIIRAARTSVFFIDERQIIQPREANRIQDLREAAIAENAEVVHLKLEAQHRLCGSIEFMKWVDALLSSAQPTAHRLGDCGTFNIEVMERPEDLVRVHEEHETETPNSSRLLTGWCWMWSQKTSDDGSLLDEVIIPNVLSRPWEAPKQGKRARLAKGLARGEYWATHASGTKSFGSVYTAQGFDMPIICLLWPRDLLWRNGVWVGNPERRNTKPGAARGGNPNYDNVDPFLAKLDEKQIVPYLLNVYRILLTRATKRMYVSFLDKETETAFRSLLAQ